MIVQEAVSEVRKSREGVAVLLDTLLVRLLLLPAVLRLLGPHAWWTPRLLDRVPQALRLRHG